MNNDHLKIWKSIENIAYIHRLSLSALAKKAGLDSTTFNKSKRFYPSGKCRWPSIETISKVLDVTGMNWEEFGRFVQRIDDNYL